MYSQYFVFPLSSDHSRWAEFGEYVGGVLNPILSFLAFIGLLLTLYLQKRSIQTQSFENHFFNLLNYYYKILDGINIGNINEKDFISGRKCFKFFSDSILSRHLVFDNCVNRIDTYNDFYYRYNNEVGHYFRHLYRVYLYIDKSNVTDSDKTKYTGILRAQLSFDELVVLFYNGISKNGEKFKPLIEKYEMFENLPNTFLHDINDDLLKYDKKAFGDNSQNIEYYTFKFESNLSEWR